MTHITQTHIWKLRSGNFCANTITFAFSFRV